MHFRPLLATLTAAGLIAIAMPPARSADDPEAKPVEAPKPELAPAALKTLREACDFYKQRKSLSVEIVSKATQEMPGQPKGEHIVAYRLSSQKPNLLSLQVTTPGETQSVISDGKTVWNYVPDLQQFVVEDAPRDLETLIRDGSAVRSAAGRLGSVTNFLRSNPANVYLQGVTKLTSVGQEKIGDVACARIHGEDDLMDWDAWFQTGPEPTLRRFVFNPLRGMLANAPEDVRAQMKDAKVELTLDYSNWKFDSALPAATFAFEPPKEAKKMAAIDPNPPEAAAQEGGGGEPAEKLKGQPAQDFALATLDGKKMQLAAHKDKEIVILDFWATWCGPCVKALPEVTAAAEAYKDKGVVFYAVNQQEDPATVKKFLAAKKLAINVAMDAEGVAAKLYRVTGIPQTVIIGKNGRVAAVHIGYSPGIKDALSKEIDRLLANPNEPAAAVADAAPGAAPEPEEEAEPAEKLKGQDAQDFSLALLDGQKMQLASHKDKQIVILDFWATWCGPCVKALPEVAATAEAFKDKGVVLYAVNQQEDAATVKKFLTAKKLGVTVAMDAEGVAAKLYKVTGIPQTVIIGKDGKVAAVHIGYSSHMKEELTKEIEKLLAK